MKRRKHTTEKQVKLCTTWDNNENALYFYCTMLDVFVKFYFIGCVLMRVVERILLIYATVV